MNDDGTFACRKEVIEMSVFVKFETPKELSDKAYTLAEMARDGGKIKKGTNEVTKAVERGAAAMVIMAVDVEPPEILAHMPALCDERKVPYVYVPSKVELGAAIGLDKPTASIAIVDVGKGKAVCEEIAQAVANLKN
jgi:large subunit ribosomal protein L7Ae